jgi:hypothetical protein
LCVEVITRVGALVGRSHGNAANEDSNAQAQNNVHRLGYQ